MPGTILRRWLILGGALLATVVASVWPRDHQRAALEVVAPVTRRDDAPPRPRSLPADSELPELGERLERAQAVPGLPDPVPDLFGARTWSPPPARVKPGQAAAAAPVAPPFPYAITGSADTGTGPVAVFSRQNQDFAVKAGELLEQTYRVDAIDAQSVTVTYLPLGLTQVVAIQRN